MTLQSDTFSRGDLSAAPLVGGESAVLVGDSVWAANIRQEIRLVASRSVTTIITGPSGTGKELIARSIHASSGRANQPFVPVDCASVAGTLFASQMFGHEKGAFTGAGCASLGAFRAAHGGTIFLDELGELELDAQARLLRVLQERVVVPVGGLKEIPVDVRVVAATNRDLQSEVAAGRFREDLFYRLSVVSLKTTPLALRREDIPPLVKSLTARIVVRHGLPAKPISDQALDSLLQYDWPGNVRELNNVLERALLYCDAERIEPIHLPEAIRTSSSPKGLSPFQGANRLKDAFSGTIRSDSASSAEDRQAWPTMAEMERLHLLATLQQTEFNQTAAARLLGLDRHALRRSIRRLGIELPSKAPRNAK